VDKIDQCLSGFGLGKGVVIGVKRHLECRARRTARGWNAALRDQRWKAKADKPGKKHNISKSSNAADHAHWTAARDSGLRPAEKKKRAARSDPFR
jgi:hypothetical protein